jgi:hypothetical protein
MGAICKFATEPLGRPYVLSHPVKQTVFPVHIVCFTTFSPGCLPPTPQVGPFTKLIRINELSSLVNLRFTMHSHLGACCKFVIDVLEGSFILTHTHLQLPSNTYLSLDCASLPEFLLPIYPGWTFQSHPSRLTNLFSVFIVRLTARSHLGACCQFVTERVHGQRSRGLVEHKSGRPFHSRRLPPLVCRCPILV